MTDTHELWLAVDKLTKPTVLKLHRDSAVAATWLRSLRDDPSVTVCDIATYRAATLSHGTVASLWEQATWALTTGSEPMEEGGRSPLASRSPADLDLMEIMGTIRDTVAAQLAEWRLAGRLTVPAQLRQLASHVGGHLPDDVGWWTYRTAQWARMLGVYLRAVDLGPRPVRLRNASCPACSARTVTLKGGDEDQVVPALVIDFTQDGYARATECLSCHFTWWRGDDMERLAVELNLADGLGETLGEATA